MMSSSEPKKNRVIFILSILGIAIAIYVTQSFIRKTGIYCVNSGGCEAVRKSPASYLFGFFPVPAVGLIGYTVLAISSFLKTTSPSEKTSKTLSTIMLSMSSFGVLFVSWFTYTELFIIKGICTWCAISAVNMVIIFAVIVQSYLQKKSDTV